MFLTSLTDCFTNDCTRQIFNGNLNAQKFQNSVYTLRIFEMYFASRPKDYRVVETLTRIGVQSIG